MQSVMWMLSHTSANTTQILPSKLNPRNVDNNATEDFDFNVHFHEHHSDPPPSTDDMKSLDDEALTDYSGRKRHFLAIA